MAVATATDDRQERPGEVRLAASAVMAEVAGGELVPVEPLKAGER